MITRINDVCSGEITIAQPGFHGRRAKYRVAVSCGECSPDTDARSSVMRREIAQGIVAVDYVRGRADAEYRLQELAVKCSRNYINGRK